MPPLRAIGQPRPVVESQADVERQVERVQNEVVVPTPWIYIGDPGAPAFQNSWRNEPVGYGGPCGFRKVGGMVEFRGTVEGRNNTAHPVFTLPVAYRPVVTRSLSIAYFDGAGAGTGPWEQGLLEITAAGAVNLFDNNWARLVGWGGWTFDGKSFPLGGR